MSRESHIFDAGLFGAQRTVNDYECFGWEVLSINGNQIVMSRETQNPVYTDLVKAQADYEEKVAALTAHIVREPRFTNTYTPIKLSTCFWSFVCFVIPCAVYIGYKCYQKSKYNKAQIAWQMAHNQWEAQKKALIEQIKKIALDSRVNFFAKK